MKTEALLKIHFVVLTILGGCLLGGVSGTESLATIAVSAGIFSLIFVDWLAIVYLPPSIAYLLMGIASIYCVGGFWSGVDDRQIAAVARLLVLVQAVLHLQIKSRRVFEQLSVFALLELIVAAVLNDALFFGLLLIPFAIVGMSTMVHLQAYICQTHAGAASRNGLIEPQAAAFETRGLRVASLGFVILGPSILAFAGTFFYALPRSAGGGLPAARPGQGVTGYSDRVQFEQMGKLLQNPRKVMRFELRDNETGKPYRLMKPAYLRGQVLDGYKWDLINNRGEWVSLRRREYVGNHRLPREFIEENADRRNRYDRVEASFRVEPMNTSTIFSIPPYYESQFVDTIRHWPRQWLLKRSGTEDRNERLEYSFTTHAFIAGRQTNYIRYVDLSSQRHYPGTMGTSERQTLLDIDRRRFPTLIQRADEVAAERRGNSEYLADVATGLQRYLSNNPDFTYSLDTSHDRPRDVDPLEFFVASKKQGHCQYYAGALALMLRSQGIPARLVVGYKTDEYNRFGEYYIVRQLHAHAWVEAYFERHQLQSYVELYGQAPEGGVWMRLDATPGSDDELASGRVSHMMDFAQLLWDDYVLDMSNRRQAGTLQDLGQGVGEIPAYKLYLDKIDELIRNFKSGNFGAGSIAIHEIFSWRVTVLSVFVCIGAILAWRSSFRFTSLLPFRRSAVAAAAPSGVGFFDRLCGLLSQAGLSRNRAQTPREFACLAQARLKCNDQHSGDLHRIITRLYERQFGALTRLPPHQQQEIEQSLQRIEAMIRDRNDRTP